MMVANLVKYPSGRILIHTFVLCNTLLHLRKPHVKFYFNAVLRYAKGIG